MKSRAINVCQNDSNDNEIHNEQSRLCGRLIFHLWIIIWKILSGGRGGVTSYDYEIYSFLFKVKLNNRQIKI